jgi:hypothetical protein
MEETELTDKTKLPRVLYHVVPERVFSACVTKNGVYDGRSQLAWGKGAPYIHTTTDLETLKRRVSGNWQQYPLKEQFLLLKIQTDKIDPPSKITYADYNGIRYYHLWSVLPAASFEQSEIRREADGSFDL